MRTKNLSLIFVFLLTLSVISAATTTGKLTFDTGGGTIVINPEACEEDWTYTWGACINNKQIKLCFDKNYCGTDDMEPADCWTTRDCTTLYCGDGTCNNGEDCNSCSSDCGTCATVTSSGGGGGGGSSRRCGNGKCETGETSASCPADCSVIQTIATSDTTNTESTCIENWECSEWSNSKSSCGTRTCEDSNKCGTSNLKPKLSEKCSGVGLFGLTGLSVEGITDFVKTNTAGSILILVVVVGGILFVVFRKNIKKLAVKKHNNP